MEYSSGRLSDSWLLSPGQALQTLPWEFSAGKEEPPGHQNVRDKDLKGHHGSAVALSPRARSPCVGAPVTRAGCFAYGESLRVCQDRWQVWQVISFTIHITNLPHLLCQLLWVKHAVLVSRRQVWAPQHRAGEAVSPSQHRPQG